MKTKLNLAVIFLVALVMLTCSCNRRNSGKDDQAEYLYVFNWETNDSIESVVRVYFDSLFVYCVNGNRGEYKCIMTESQNYWLEREINGVIDTSFTYSCRTFGKQIVDSIRSIPDSYVEVDSIVYSFTGRHLWSTGDTTDVISVSEPGDYWVDEEIEITKYLHDGSTIHYFEEQRSRFFVKDVASEVNIYPRSNTLLNPTNPANPASPLSPANPANPSSPLYRF